MPDKKSDKNDVISIESKIDGDIFDDLDQLRIGQNYADAIGVKKIISTIPVRKPSPQDFIRVHPDESYHFQTAILELKEDRENFLVSPSLWPELPEEVTPKALYTSINRQGVLFLWPVRLPDETGRLDPWNRSAHKHAKMAMEHWIKIRSNRSLGAYEASTPTGNLPDPEWSDISFKEILKIAFRDNRIESLDHPVLKRLRGEI
jgi:hypothetical protein